MRQYHAGQVPISPAVFTPVSSVQFVVDSRAYLPLDQLSKETLYSRAALEAAQYRRDPALLVAVALGAIYVVFLAVWFWATRVRSTRR